MRIFMRIRGIFNSLGIARNAVRKSKQEKMDEGKHMMVMFKTDRGYEPKEMDDQELIDWFREHTKDGVVEEDIVLFHDAEVKADSSRVHFVFSDYSMDTDLERIDPKGWDLKNYKKNPVILWSHDWMRPAIGTGSKLKKSDTALEGNVQFDESGLDPFAMMIASKVKSGVLTKGSVGFMPLKIELIEDKKDPTRLIHREQELLEFSIVNIPANINATVSETSRKYPDEIVPYIKEVAEEIEKEYDDNEPERETSAEDEPSPEMVDKSNQLDEWFTHKPIGDLFS